MFRFCSSRQRGSFVHLFSYLKYLPSTTYQVRLYSLLHGTYFILWRSLRVALILAGVSGAWWAMSLPPLASLESAEQVVQTEVTRMPHDVPFIAPSYAEDLRIVHQPLLPNSSTASSAQLQARVSYQILISWSIPEPELARIFAYAYQYQLPLLLQGFNARGQEASISANQQRVANLIAKYQLLGIPQVYIDERRFTQLEYPQVPVLIQVAQRIQSWSLDNPQVVQTAPTLRLLYQQYGNISLEALALECRACVRRAELQHQLQEVTLPQSASSTLGADFNAIQRFSSPFPFPQPDITQVGTGVNSAPANRPQEELPRVTGGTDPATPHSSSSSSLSFITTRVSEFNVLLGQVTPSRVHGAVYPIAEQAFSALARERLAQAQQAGKLNFTAVRAQTPFTLLEQTRALKLPTLVRLRNRLETSLRELTMRQANLNVRLNFLHVQSTTSTQVITSSTLRTQLEQQLEQIQAQVLSLRTALSEIEAERYPLVQAQHIHQVDFHPERSWQIPHELLSAAQATPAPQLHALLIFVDLSNPQLQALLKDYFVEWHWLVSQPDSVVIVTEVSELMPSVNAQDNSLAGWSDLATAAPNLSGVRHALAHWLGTKQVLLFNASLSGSFSPTAFTTVQQATTHDLVQTHLTLPQVLRGKVLVRDWSLSDLEQWLCYIRAQRAMQVRSLQ